MDASTVIALLAVIIAVIVPWFTFRLAMRQDQVRWIRDQRAALYVDMLTAADAEYEWLEVATADEETRESAKEWFTDKRLPPLERERLTARGTAFASQAVNQVFNRLTSEAFRLTIGRREPDPGQIIFRMRMGGILNELKEAVRRELGTDRVPLNGPRSTVPARDPGARSAGML